MNGYERITRYLDGKKVDRPPFAPLVIQWVSQQCGVPYNEFVYNPNLRAKCYLEIVEKYDIDCVLPDADFSEQLEDFGQVPKWENGEFQVQPIIPDLDSAMTLKLPEIKPGTRQGNRLEIIQQVAQHCKGEKYIFGICIGPLTEFANARGVEDAICELIDEDYRDKVLQYMDLFCANGLNFIRAQMDAGADGIQIVEPVCSLISPDLYRELILPYHKKLVSCIQERGGLARLHICGNTTKAMPDILDSGSRIVDVDSAVDLGSVAGLLGEKQCFCGNLDTTQELLNAKPEQYDAIVAKRWNAAKNRVIFCSGCDVPPATPSENVRAFHDAVAALR